MSQSTTDPSHSANDGPGIFGLSTSEKDAALTLLPVPWDVTTSYGQGTRNGPQAILKASPQLDLFDPELGDPSDCGFHLLSEDHELRALGERLRPAAEKVMMNPANAGPALLDEVNEGCEKMFQHTLKRTRKQLAHGKTVGLIGGDHSTSFGAIAAHLEHYRGDFSILHLDAHFDLRQAYQGFTHSHASVMYNAMTSSTRPQSLVQVGIRDFCEEEYLFASEDADIHCFFDQGLAERAFSGQSWSQTCEEIISHLSEKVYVSCDIDGLSPDLCPGTGTPVPGGLSFQQWNHLLRQLAASGREIIGFDLVEVSPSMSNPNDEWDANVGARVLYKLCSWTAKSRGWLEGEK